ncbi:hypothetical protein EYC98_13510 [Halieaceae bacterium IMCC14734]|uniref:Nitrogen fixation protein FixH n=1 Tax=Candidatus Litorirhabdus singularis TaxID=2518993 RepID=A0ABT3TJA4_9GAMM|nr:FixH family protein [Candidatus Litorirhabdus singularis]MCX2981875.1 hypothetical protein [Candidatus Litorirhabdus singularis]
MDELPWYRYIWTWVIFGLPAIVVVAGLSTWWIAANDADSLVVDEYYKEGLAINRRLDHEAAAARLNMRAELTVADAMLTIVMSGDAKPAALSVLLSHPLDADLDQTLRVPKVGDRLYQVPIQLPSQPRWHWRIKPLANTAQEWQLQGELIR